ncbi:MAG: hypothetical protein M1840_004935 [Geoglossum simile]|nr:MAG: hypothetical protein M1840_004935 [Geoglossum simile]
MAKEEKVPDAWDDDWGTQIDQHNKDTTGTTKESKAERLAKHAESNRKLWDSAESTDNFLFLATKEDVPLRTEFKPAVKVLSRKPASKVLSRADPGSGISQLTLDDEDDEDDGAERRHKPSPEELRLKAQREREEKQRRYEEARERLFGSPASASGTSSPGTLTPPRAGESKGARGKGRGKGGRDSKASSESTSNSRSKKPPIEATTDRASDGRQLYDPDYVAKPDSEFIRKRSTPLPGTTQSILDEGQQPIRSPRGPDGSGRGGFGFSERAHRGYPRRLKNITYIPGPGSTSLHTLDVYLPRQPSQEEIGKLWVIYIHGGAWRDPDISAESFGPALSLLLEGQRKDDIAGFASINYRLSPYSHHTTSPSSSDDPSRSAKHPDHIRDVFAALHFLQQQYGFEERYLLAGHSCGATLAFQIAMGRWDWTSSDMEITLPLGILGLEGIYDFVNFRNHHRNIPAYQNILEGAFGRSEDTWVEASPSSGDYGKSWPNGRLALIIHSLEDELVEKEQATLMDQTLRRGGAAGERNTRANVFRFLKAGKHDEIWECGTALAAMIEQAVGLLAKELITH